MSILKILVENRSPSRVILYMTGDNGRLLEPSRLGSKSESDSLLTATSTDTRAVIQVLVDEAKGFASQAKAPNTTKAYQKDWTAFSSWCRSAGFEALPARPELVTLYVTRLATSGRKVATISRALVSISQCHKMKGYPSPTSTAQVQEVMKGVRRSLGTAQCQKSAVEVASLRAMVAELGDNLLGLRDRAILLVGFAGAFRRAELVNLNTGDIEFSSDGLIITIRRSKTDQEGQGRKIGLPYGGSPLTCPVRAMRAWLTAAKITEGPAFRSVGRWSHIGRAHLSGRSVAAIVKKYACLIGLDSSLYAGHSLRSGFATSAARAGKSERSIMNQTGHNSVAMVRKYIRRGSLFMDNAASGLL